MISILLKMEDPGQYLKIKTTRFFLSGMTSKGSKEQPGKSVFINSTFIPKIKQSHWIKCFKGPVSFFTVTVTIPVRSSVINDMVLNPDMKDGRFYFKDGHPDWLDNPGMNGIRTQNKDKRAFAWNRFMEALRKEGRYKE